MNHTDLNMHMWAMREIAMTLNHWLQSTFVTLRMRETIRPEIVRHRTFGESACLRARLGILRPRLAIFLFLCLASLGCLSCGSTTRAATTPAPPSVSVITVSPEDAPIYKEYAAQTFARDMVEVRGRVDGYIEKRLFQVGSDVKAGQPLYVLDLRPYQAEVQKAKGDLAQTEANHEFASHQVALLQAEADLAQAQANLLKATQDVDRLRPLGKEDAAAQQDPANALAALQANQANVRA